MRAMHLITTLALAALLVPGAVAQNKSATGRTAPDQEEFCEAEGVLGSELHWATPRDKQMKAEIVDLVISAKSGEIVALVLDIDDVDGERLAGVSDLQWDRQRNAFWTSISNESLKDAHRIDRDQVREKGFSEELLRRISGLDAMSPKPGPDGHGERDHDGRGHEEEKDRHGRENERGYGGRETGGMRPDVDPYHQDADRKSSVQIDGQTYDTCTRSHFLLSEADDVNIHAENGEHIGEVERIILDPRNMKLCFITIDTGHALDFGSPEYIVPANTVRMVRNSRQATENALLVPCSKSTIENGPRYKKPDTPILTPDLAEEARKAYGGHDQDSGDDRSERKRQQGRGSDRK